MPISKYRPEGLKVYYTLSALLLLGMLSLTACKPEQFVQQLKGSMEETRARSTQKFTPEGGRIYYSLWLSDVILAGDLEQAYRLGHELLSVEPSAANFRKVVSIALAQGDPQGAMQTAETGLLLHPHDAVLNAAYAETLIQAGKTEQAISVLEQYYAYALAQKDQPPANADQEYSEDDSEDAPEPDIQGLQIWLMRLYASQERPEDALRLARAIPAERQSLLVRLEEAKILRKLNRNQEAYAKLKILARDNPEFAEGLATLAIYNEQDGNYKTAARYYFAAFAAEAVPDLWLRGISMLVAARQMEQAATLARRFTGDIELPLRASTIFMDAQQWEYAEQILQALASRPGDNPSVNFYLAILNYEWRGNMPEAMRFLNNIPPENSYRSFALKMKISLLAQMNQLPEAIKTALMLKSEYPQDKESWIMLARLYMQDKHPQEAEAVLQDALVQWPDDVELLYDLGAIMDQNNKKEEAMRTMNKVLEIDPDNAKALNYAGYTLADENRELPKALDMINKALALDPGAVHIMDSLAWVHFRLGNLHEAWRIIQDCVEKEQGEPELWEHYADIAAALGHKEAAVSGYTKALQLNSKNTSAVQEKLNNTKQ